jgi:hypothetical protein
VTASGRKARGAVAAVLLFCSLGGCKASSRNTASGAGPAEPDAAPVDAGGTALVVDAGHPEDTLLPQMVPPNQEELVTRARHLLEAIAQDDATRAGDILFPRDGWIATRDATDPGKDWNARASEPFRRAVHALSRRHKDIDHAQVVSLELGQTLVQATPRKHGWKVPVWTVGGCHLTFVVDGHTRVLPIREMAAWRGAWYVTRLR